VPQGLELSAVSCIQHQNLRNHIWELTIIPAFEPFIPPGTYIKRPFCSYPTTILL